MPPPSPALALMGLLTLSVFAGILVAWAWAIRRFGSGRPFLPTAPPRRVPWHGGTILGIILLYVVLGRTLSFGYGALLGPAPGDPPAPGAAVPAAEKAKPQRPPEDTLALQAVMNVAILAFVPAFLRRTTGTTLADLGLADPDHRVNFGRGFVAFFLLAPVVYGLMIAAVEVWPRQSHPIEDMLQKRLDPGTAALALLSSVVLAPLVEELLFRGLILGWLRRLFDPASVYVPTPVAEGGDDLPILAGGEPAAAGRGPSRFLPDLLTAAVFAALHAAQWPAPVPLFALALGLGVLMRRTGSLWAPIGLHATFNGVSTALMLLAGAAGVPLDPNARDPAPVPAPAAGAGVALGSTWMDGLPLRGNIDR
jgi:membrane protease YdiL (CAAX protease family)